MLEGNIIGKEEPVKGRCYQRLKTGSEGPGGGGGRTRDQESSSEDRGGGLVPL